MPSYKNVYFYYYSIKNAICFEIPDVFFVNVILKIIVLQWKVSTTKLFLTKNYIYNVNII